MQKSSKLSAYTDMEFETKNSKEFLLSTWQVRYEYIDI